MSRQIPVKAEGYEAIAVKQGTLTFPAPMADSGTNQAGFDFYWSLLTYVFGLDDPSDESPVGVALDSGDRAVLSRYLVVCREMAESEMLNVEQSLTLSTAKNGQPVIERSFSSKETMRGFVVLFRQMFANDDSASFLKVHRLVSRINESSADPDRARRRELLKNWKKAEGKLRADRIRTLTLRKLESDGLVPPAPGPRHTDPSPSELISAYNYGDLIHWGKGRDALSSYSKEPFDEAHRLISFLESVAGMCHLYMGFGVLVGTLFPEA